MFIGAQKNIQKDAGNTRMLTKIQSQAGGGRQGWDKHALIERTSGWKNRAKGKRM